MPKGYKLSEKDIEKIKERKRSGESGASIAKDFGIAGSVVAYHVKKDKKAKRTKAPRKQMAPKYIDMPLNTPKKVAVIITDSNSIAQVLGDLWK